MGFLDKLQEEMKKNLQEGMEIFKEGSSVVTEKIEQLTEGSKSKYKIFNINMKIQEEYAKLGEEVFALIEKKSKNPLGNKNVKSLISGIKKLEAQIDKLEPGEKTVPIKTAAKKTKRKPSKKAAKKTARKTASKKTTAKKASKSRAKPKASARPSKAAPEPSKK